MNQARNLLAILVVGMFITPTFGSRKFDATSYLKYPMTACPVSGDSFGVAMWVNTPGDPNPSLNMIHNVDASGQGFRIYLHYSQFAGPLFIFDYTGSQQEGFPNIAVSAVLQQPSTWVHLAVDLTIQQGTTQARIFLNGSLAGTATSTNNFTSIGGANELRIGGAPYITGFIGDIHDVCIKNSSWIESPLGPFFPELVAMQTQSAQDSVGAGLVFNARLRQSANDLISGLTADLVCNPTVGPPGPCPPINQGMGPPINYGDQLPTVLVLGDPQNLDYGLECENEPVQMQNLGQFIYDYRKSLRIAAVFCVGDWIVCASEEEHQTCRARALADKLNAAGIPWSCTLGNHDYNVAICNGGPLIRDVSYWSQDKPFAMPTSLFTQQSWHLAQWVNTPPGDPSDKGYLHAFRFYIDGQPQIGIAAPLTLTEERLAWIQSIAALEPNSPVWLVTHYFLVPGVPTAQHATFVSHFGDDATEHPVTAANAMTDFLREIPNLRFVFSGHVWDGPWSARRRCDNTKWGQPIHQLLVNSQQGPNGGGGFMQILTISSQSRSASVESYIPLSDEFYAPPGNQPPQLPQYFTFTLDLSAPCDGN